MTKYNAEVDGYMVLAQVGDKHIDVNSPLDLLSNERTVNGYAHLREKQLAGKVQTLDHADLITLYKTSKDDADFQDSFL